MGHINYELISKLDGAIRALLDSDDNKKTVYSNGIIIDDDLDLFFDQDYCIKAFNCYLDGQHWNCMIANLENRLLLIEYESNFPKTHAKECKITMIPNASGKFVEMSEDYHYMRIVDGFDTVYTRWFRCANGKEFVGDKLSLNEVIKPTDYSEINDRVRRILNRELLVKMIEKLSDDDVFKLLNLIELNQETRQPKLLTKAL